MQEPALHPLHLIHGDHEAAVAAGDAATGGVGQQQGVPAGAVGGGQQHRPLRRQMLPPPHLHPSEKARQGEVLGEEHRHR